MENKSERRLKILSSSEYKEIYGIPIFDENRADFFLLDDLELSYLNQFRAVKAKILFVLQLGYFKCSYRFFSFNFLDCIDDCQYIANHYFGSCNLKLLNKSLKNKCSQGTILKQRTIILDILSFKNFSEFKNNFIAKGAEIVKIDANPKYIFRELLKYSNKYQFIFPAYSTAQKIISQILLAEENRIFDLLKELIDQELASDINALLTKESESRYLLTLIKSPATGFSYQDIVKEVKKKQALNKIFNKAHIIINKLDISNSVTYHFAKLVSNYKIFDLQRFHQQKQQLYIICFIYYHYQKINDNLIKTFIHLMGKYQSNAKEAVDEYILEINLKQNKNYQKLPQILKLLIRDDNDLKFSAFQQEVFEILPKDKIESLSDWLIKTTFDKKKLSWKAYDKQSRIINLNIRQLFYNLEFSYQSTASFYNDFFIAVSFLKNPKRKLQFGKTPTAFIKLQEQRFILEYDKNIKNYNINSNRYETLIYKILRRKIMSNDIFIKNSLEYRHIENDLINEGFFLKNHQEILNSLDLLPHINKPLKETLESKIAELEEAIHRVNKNIIDNQNPHFEIKDNNKWSLNYDNINNLNLTDNIFESLPQIDLTDIINFVDYKTGVLSNFTHILNKNTNNNPDIEILKAAITAQATNIGFKQMATSSGLSYNKLKDTSINFIREETLKIANEKLVNETKKLPIFKHYSVASNDQIFAAIDGQKFMVGIDTINARYSSKYFGKDKGVSALTMSANFQALAFKLISSNDYEGHYNLELFLMNESKIQPDYQSSDTHGGNDINFALFDFFGCIFAPRFADLNYRSQFLYGTKDLKLYPDNYILKPSNIINQNLILEEEFNMKRIIASLALKTTTVSTIIKKISSSPKSNKTRKALAEYDKIIRSIYILNYIDNLNLRQHVQKAVNRQELYHKLKRRVGFDKGGKIMARSESEQIICQECNRLICNMIVYYNSYILSQFLLQKEELKQTEQIDALKKISPIAWRHINFYGKYNFIASKNGNIDLEKINRILASISLV